MSEAYCGCSSFHKKVITIKSLLNINLNILPEKFAASNYHEKFSHQKLSDIKFVRESEKCICKKDLAIWV